jgi:enoyl-CoA hydratase/carnithine racemase
LLEENPKMTELVVVERRGPIQIIRINRPDKKNALTRAMYGAMAEALRAGDADPEIRCHAILGVPGSFSAGNDMGDFMVVASGGKGGDEVFNFLLALAELGKPLVSGVDGIAVGIGMTINLHCDLTFASRRTVFRTPFVDLGIVPEAASTLLVPPIVGRQQAFAILALGEPLPAARAKELGLIYEVCGDDEVESKALAAAKVIAAKPPQALRIARNLLLGERQPVKDRIMLEGRHFSERLTSDEARAAIMSFMTRKAS